MVRARIEDSRTAHSWLEAKRKARQQGYGEKIEIPKSSAPVLPQEFEESTLSIQLRANAVYRDQRRTDSFQVREYEEKWTVELDRHNPETGNALAHAVQDAPGYTAVAAVSVVAAVGGIGS